MYNQYFALAGTNGIVSRLGRCLKRKLCHYSLFQVLSVKTSYEEFSNLKRIQKKIEKSSIKPIIGFDREDIK